MSEAPDIRRWAAQVARQAGEEPDAQEALRLMRISEYWVKLAESRRRELLNQVRLFFGNTSPLEAIPPLICLDCSVAMPN